MSAKYIAVLGTAPVVADLATTGASGLLINRYYGAIRTADDVPGYPSNGAGAGAPGAGTTLPLMS